MGAQVLSSGLGLQVQPDDTEHDLLGSESHVVDRVAKDGRRLWYCLKVIQQPERARACGAGAKSSADRRPVDPPPVVRLRIFEGHTPEAAQAKDVTFQYNANFFLFASLEHARVIAHGRVQNAAPIAPPILTGMPVSGMAYLDRPEEAGYFLFPDLSVRHEGRYRLTFSLYEETKEDRDKDPDAPPMPPLGPNFSYAGPGSFDFRMEVKSQDFVVYSAKKFPGLAESTGLSKAIAEQGCRVRIRRDVRMRRRDGKGSRAAGGDAAAPSATAEAEEQYRRRRATATPDIQSDNFRARSVSGSTERTPYAGDTSRRPSMTDYAPHPPQFPGPGQPTSAGGHLQFLGSSNAQFPSHPQSFPQPASVPPSPVYAPTQAASYQSQAPYPTAPATPSYGPDSRGAQSYPSAAAATPASTAPTRRDSAPREYRSSTSSASGVSLPPLSLPSQSSPFLAGPQAPTKAHKALTTLPPLQVDPNLLNRSTSRTSIMSPTLAGLSRSCLVAAAGVFAPPRSAMPSAHAGTKRPRDLKVARDPEQNRFHNGARDTASEDEDEEQQIMMYKRADGKLELANTPLALG